MRESGILKRFISLLTCLLIVMSTVGDVSGVFVPASSPLRQPGTNIINGLTQSLSESSRTVVLSNVEREADPSTMDTYKSMLDFTDDTRYVGRLWSDKTVFAYNYTDAGGDTDWNSTSNTLTLNEEDDGLSGSVALDSGFLHVFSALGSSEQITEVVLPAVDLVILIDMSGSMGYDLKHLGTHSHTDEAERIACSRIGSVVDSINEAIDDLMKKNDTNRVAVIGYGATAAVILPLGHYKSTNGDGKYITVSQFSKYGTNIENYSTSDTTSAAYTVTGSAQKATEYNNNGKPTNWTKVENKVRNDYSADGTKDTTLIGYHTDLQAGIYLGFNELYKNLTKEEDATYTYYSSVKNEYRKVQRVPIAFVMSDGGSNYALKGESIPDGGTGDEWHKVPIASSVSNSSSWGGDIKKYRAESDKSDGGKGGGDAVILDILLTASYMKSKVENKYTELLQKAGLLGEGESADFQVHTISVDTPEQVWQVPRVYAALDPVDYFNKDGGKGNGKDTLDEKKWWKQRDDITNAFDEFGEWQEKSKDEYITVDFKDSDSKNQEIKFKGYDDTVDDEVPKSDVIKNINYNDSFTDLDTAGLTQHFKDLIAKFYEPTFIPAAGGNDLGVKDSVTYVDPIGKYMEVKDVKGLSLFGSYYGIVETAEYNWQFNDDYIRNHNGEPGTTTFTEGWYRGESGTDAEFAGQEDGKAKLPTGCTDSNAAWAAGWVYRVSSDTAAKFVPSLEEIKKSNPDDKIKHTTYRFFRLDTVKNSEGTKTLDAAARDVVNMNPAYGKTFPNSYKPDKYQETPGAYKLSDLRIWVEDSGDYSDSSIEDSGSKTDANFDEALYINIPVNMLPLRTVNIDLSQVDPNKPMEDTSKYTTNQMYLRDKNGEYKDKNETDGNAASFPLRVFYTVGIEDDYIKENNIDLTGVSLEYLNENRANTQDAAKSRGIGLGSVEFFSNWYNPAARYSDYATTQNDYTFGDPMISFSPSTDNRYYIFEKALPIYDTAYVYTGGQWRRVAINETSGSADSQTFLPADFGGKLLAQDLEVTNQTPSSQDITDALGKIEELKGYTPVERDIVLLKSDRLDDVTKPEQEGEKDPFSSDAYYFFAIEYYTKSSTTGGASLVRYVITRKGSEFGSAYHISGITNGDMLVWHDLSGQYPDYPYLSYSETHNASRGKDFIGVELDEKTGYYKNLDKSRHQIPTGDYTNPSTGYKSEINTQGQWVVATKPGGLRVGALAQAVQLKGTTYKEYDKNYIKDRFPDYINTTWRYYNNNITRTSNSYYLPTISSSSQVGKDDVIVNVYLGNNGRLEVQDTELLLTKLVESPLSGAEPDPDKEFDFQVYIKGFTQDEQAIVVRYNPETQNWQRQLHYIDLELSANLFLQTSDGNLVLVDKTGKRVIRSYGATYDEGSGTYKYTYTYADGGGEYNPTDGGPYYVYIGTNTNSSADIKAPVTGLRVFHNDAVDSNGSVSPDDVKAEFYKNAEPGEDSDTKLDTEQFTDWNAISGADYVKFSKRVYLFTQNEYDSFSGTSDLTGRTAIDNFELVKVSFDSKSDMITIDSDYRTSSAYWRETVSFGTRPATDEEIAANEADENGRIKLQASDLYFPDNVNAEPANTAVVKLRSGWGLIFSSPKHSTNYALVEHLGDDDLEQGYSFDRIKHVQQSSTATTKTAADFANAEKPHEHDYYISGDTAGKGETKIEEGHFFNVWNLLKDETAVNGDEVEKNEETGLYPPVNVGDEITYTIKWANHTDEDGEVRITDFLDTGVDFVEAGMVPGESENPQYVYGSGKATAARPSFSGTTDDGRYAYSVEYDPDSHSVTWIIGSNSDSTAAGDKTFGTAVVGGKVAKGDFGTVTLTVRVNDKAEKTWNYGSDSGTGAPGDGEDNLVHNRATVAVGDNSYTTNIVTNPCGTPDKNEIGIEHAGNKETITDDKGVYDPDKNLWEGPAVHVGDIIEYEITFDNNIAEPAVITVTDPLDPNVSFVEAQIGSITLKSGQTHASGEISLTYTKEDGTPATVNNVPADIWLRERDGVTYVIWGIGSVTEQMPSYDKEFNASHAIPVPPTATGTATLKVKVEEGALVPHQVENYADVQVGNSRTVRTKTVENKLPEPEKTEITPGDGKQVEVGEEITYKITWQNRNATPAVVTVTDPLDIGVDFLEAAVGDALLNYSSTEYKGNVTIGDASVPVTIKYENHTVTWTFGEESGVMVPGNTSGEVTLKVRVNEKAVTTWTYNNENDGGSEGAGKDYEIVNRASVKVGNDVQFTDIVENPVPEKTEEDGKEDKPLQVGDNVTYKIHWKNGYDRPAKVVVTDPLDKGVDFVSASYDSVELDAANTTAAGSVTFDGVSVPVGIKFENGTVTWTIGDDDTKVPAGASGDVSLIVKVNKDAIKTWSYKEGAGTEGDDANDYRIVNRARVEVDNQGAYTAEVENPVPEKTEADPGEDMPVKVGDVVTYNIGWKNTADNGTAITVTDKLDPGVDFVSAGMLEGPDDELYVYGGNGITADSRTYTGVTSEGYAYLITYNPLTHTVTWTIGKNGNSVETGGQQLGGEFVTPLPAGAYGILTLTVKVNENAVKTWSYDEASEDGEDHKIVNRAEIKVGNDSVTTTDVENPVPEKTETDPGDGKLVGVGEDITYEISWSNTEDKDAMVTITDPLDIGVDFVSASYGGVTLDKLGTVEADATVNSGDKQHVKIAYDAGSHTVAWTITGAAPGESGKVTLKVKVNEKAVRQWSYSENDNSGAGDAGEKDYEVVNRAEVKVDNKATFTATVENPVPEKTETAVNDTEVTEDGTPVRIGDTVTYKIAWKNGNAEEAIVTITDPLDIGADFVSAVVGKVHLDAPTASEATGTVEIGGKIVNVKIGIVGKTVTWTIGDETTRVPAGAVGEVTLTVKVNENAFTTWTYDEKVNKGEKGVGKDNEIVNRAQVQIGDKASFTAVVENPVNDKTETNPGNGKLVGIGEVITYEIEWKNGNPKAAAVVITDPLDDGVDFASAFVGDSASEGEVVIDSSENSNSGKVTIDGQAVDVTVRYDDVKRAVIWTFGTIDDDGNTVTGVPAGAAGTVTLKVKVNEKAVRQWSYSESANSGTADAGDKDYEVLNRAEVKVDNKATFTTTVENPVPEKTETAIDGKAVTGEYNVDNRTWIFDEVEVGQTITYSIHYKNVHDTAANVVIVDELNNGVDFVTAEPASTYSYDGGTRKVTWTLDNVPAHSEGDVTLTVRVNHNATITEQVENSASVTVNDVTKQTEKVVNPTPHGSFKVTKTVVDSVAGDENDEFTFTVKFEPKDNGTLWFSHEESGKTKTYTMIEDPKDNGEGKIQGNEITFKLKAGETAEFYNLPVGTVYTVTETPDDVSGKYTAEWSYNGRAAVEDNVFEEKIVEDVEGTINSVVFKNTRRKTGLTLTKVVKNGLPSDNDTVFKFTIELDYGGNDYTEDIKINGGNVHELGNGKYAAELKNGGTVKLSDLPTGVQFKITEENNNSYDAAVEVEINGKKLESIGNGWYRIDDENADITVEYTNTKHSGEIKVTKTVEGEDTSEDFSFTLQLFDTDGTELTSDKIAAYSITYNKSTGENDTVTEIPYEFKLKHGENIIFSGIPIGTKYTVTEKRDDGNKYLVFTGESHGPEDEKNIVSGDVSEALSKADFYNKPRTIPEKTEIDPHDGDTVYPGDKITYNIKWYNNYDAEADVTITDELDPDVEFVEASDNGSYDPKTNTVTWAFTADANTSGTVTLIVKVREDALDRSIDPDGDDKVENSAGVKVGNTYDVVGTPVNPIADLSIEKLQGVTEHHIAPTKDEFSVDDGYIVTYYLHIVPKGDSGATLKNVTVRDVTPSGLELVSGSEKYGKDIASLRGVSDAGTDTPHYTEVGGTVYWFIGDITLPTDSDGFWVSYNVKVPYANDYTEWVNTGEVRHGDKPVDPNNPDPDGWKPSNEVKIHEEHTQLSIEKEVKGAAEGDENREFTLKIEFFTDADFKTPLENYEFPYTTLNLPPQENSGIMLTSSPYDEYGRHTGYLTPNNTTVTIKHRQIVNIYELPVDTAVYYRVTEVLGDASGDFEVSITGGGSVTEGVVTGLIDKMDPAKLKFINTRVPYEPEKTETKINDTDVNMPSDPGKIWEGPGVTVGDEITYTIRWKNYEAQSATVIITDKLDEGVDFVSADNEGNYNGDTHTVKWIIPNVEPGVSGTVTLMVKVNEKAVKDDKTVENSALVKVGNENEQKTNTVTNEVKTGNLSITKKLEGDVINEDKEIGFEFTVTLKDGSNNDLTGAYSYDVTSSDGTIAESGTITSGGKITVKADQTATIKDLPEGTKYTVVEEPNADFTVTYGGDGSGSGTILADENITNSVTATNTRVAPPKMPDIAIHKTQAVNNGVPGEQLMTVNPGDIVTYYIDVTNTGEVPAENVVVKDAVPEGLTYIDGTAKVVTEGIECDITPPDAERTIYWAFKNDLRPGETVRLAFDVTVPAVDSETHWINIAAVKYDKPDEPHDPDDPDDPDEPGDPWTPSNEVETVEYVGEIRLTKSVENYAEGSTYEFTFRISLFHDEQLSVPVTEMNGRYGAYDYQNGVTTVSFTVNSGAWPTAQIGGIPVGLWYSIDEIEAGGYIPDFELGGSIGKITDAVTPVTISVVNREPAPENAVLTIEGIKNLDGKPSSEVFEFIIEGKLAPAGVKDIPMPENTTVKNGPDGKFCFGPIKYTVVGDYVYEIREIIPDPDNGKYVYDATVYRITVKVTENAGDLSAEIVYYATVIDGLTVPAATPSMGGGIVFNNKTVIPTGGLTVSKIVEVNPGEEVTSDKFGFRLELKDAEENALEGEYEYTGSVNGKITNGLAEFSLGNNESITVNNLPVGTVYAVTETDSKGYTVKIDGAVSESGSITGGITAERALVRYTNVAPPPPPEEETGALEVVKHVTGSGDKQKEWHITVTLGESLTGQYGDMYFENGIANFTITDGVTVTASGLPAGITYTVTELEENAESYVTTYTGKTGEIPANGTAHAEIVNDLPTTPPPPPEDETGALEVVKHVTGSGDKQKEWHITVTLGESLTGQYGDMYFENGIANFTITDGVTVTASGLPAGITYTVTELEENAESYVTTYTGKTGEIPANGTAHAEVVNDLPTTPPPPPVSETGSLTVAKTVQSPDPSDYMRPFGFVVQLSDPTVNGVYGDMMFTNGTAYITLISGQSLTASGLPAGISYSVYETDAYGFTVLVNGMPSAGSASGMILSGSVRFEAFTNISDIPEPEYGGLTVTKTVEGSGADYEKYFTFTVTLGEPLTGQYGQMYFNAGTATFTLKHGESCTASGIPAGTSYSVTESDNEGYEVTSVGEVGTVMANTVASADFINTREEPEGEKGGLTVRKIVTGRDGDQSKEFTFTVTLGDSSINGTYGGMTFVNGTASFTLRHGESLTASGLPADVSYTVTETDNEGYTVASLGETGTIPANGEAVAEFVNSRGEFDEFGSLTVAKFVTGFGIDYQNFTFTVTLSAPITGQYGQMFFNNGVAVFTLKHGETATATGLPAGVSYSVTESNNDYYVVSSTGENGIIVKNGSAYCEYVNYLTEEDRPKVLELIDPPTPTVDFNPPTGNSYIAHIGAAGLLLVIAAVGVIVKRRKER